MATITIGHKPELTAQQAMETFQRHFAGRYEVYATKQFMRDFVVKKSEWTGVGVKVKQESNATTFVFTGLMPNTIFRVLFSGLASYLFLRSSWKAFEDEIAAFIEDEKDFRPAVRAVDRAAA
jgi:hypothetical protein